MTHHAIPTKYKGVQFRSRLEAKWAAFFDLLGWRWEYEPFDRKGWIPDFILLGATPVLVEVKPVHGENDPLFAATQREVERNLHDGEEGLIVSFFLPEISGEPSLGWLRDDEGSWDAAPVGKWGSAWGFCHATQSYADRISGNHTGNWGFPNPDGLQFLWVDAGNTVQWRRVA